MAAALQARKQGSEDPLLLARMLDLSAALDGARRYLDEAIAKLAKGAGSQARGSARRASVSSLGAGVP